MVDQNHNMFDEANFVTTSALNGKRGVVIEVEAVRRSSQQYGDSTQLVLKVFGEGFAKAIPVFLRIGAKHIPAVIENGVKVPSSTGKGTHLIGPNFDKKSVMAAFLRSLKLIGFPVANMGKDDETGGYAALTGAEFTFKALEKSYGGTIGEKTYDIPCEFHGFVTPEALAALKASVPAPVTAEESTPVDPVQTQQPKTAEDVAALKVKVVAALKAALEKVSPIPRGQLSLRVGPELKAQGIGAEQTGPALAMLLKAEFYDGVEGVSADAKEVRKA